MKKHLLIASLLAGLTTLSHAQLGGVTGIRVRAGYGWSGSIRDINNDSGRLQGPELGIDFPLTQLPLVSDSLTGDVLLGGQLSHGSDLDGNVFRFLLSGRVAIPGSKFSVFGGMGIATAQARGGQFGSQNGFVTQLGVAIPITNGLPLVSPSLEIAGTIGKSALSGYSVSLAIKF